MRIRFTVLVALICGTCHFALHAQEKNSEFNSDKEEVVAALAGDKYIVEIRYDLSSRSSFSAANTIAPHIQRIGGISNYYSVKLLNPNDWCKKFTMEYFWKAYHPGTDNRQKVHRGTLNEDIPGQGFECEITKPMLKDTLLEGRGYIHGARLVNSQEGYASVAAFGYRADLLRLGNFTLSGALEIAWLEYEVPRYNATVKGFIPLPSLALMYKTEKYGSFGARHYMLPVDKITLTSFVWEVKF